LKRGKNFFYRVNPEAVLSELTSIDHSEWLQFFLNFFHDLRNDDPETTKTALAGSIIKEAQNFRSKRAVAGKASAEQRATKGQQNATHVEHMLKDVQPVAVAVAVTVADKEESKSEAGIVQGKPSRPRTKKKPKMTDDEWLVSIKENPAYEGIDIDRLIGKCKAWCQNRGYVMTRSRILNWLNREEKPLNGITTSRPKSFREQVNEAAGDAFLSGEY